jgi:SAM-dependent methyltransferase
MVGHPAQCKVFRRPGVHADTPQTPAAPGSPKDAHVNTAQQLSRLLGRTPPVDPNGPQAEADWQRQRAAQERLETNYKNFPERSQRIGEHMRGLLRKSGVTGGRVLEVGGRKNPFTEYFPGFDYSILDLDESVVENVIQGDITSCPELPSESFDVVISVDVLEHVKQPWLAAPEIMRLLRPGGFTYHSTVFSWRYDPRPADYWRFTPDSLMLLFADLRTMRSEFDTLERRRNLTGRGVHRLEPDAFGGWRENWRVFYAGVKNDPAHQAPSGLPVNGTRGPAATAGVQDTPAAALDNAEDADDILDGEED